jgi:acetyl/propionyl-CoA carboxylase alpha subunit
MLAKLIVTGDDREHARDRARTRAERVRAARLHHQPRLPRAAARPSGVRGGEIHTGFLDATRSGAEPPPSAELLRELLAAAALSCRPVRDSADAVPALHAAIGAGGTEMGHAFVLAPTSTTSGCARAPSGAATGCTSATPS